jgi:hypothetical protein
MKNKWKLIEVEDYVKVYEDAKGNIKCVYPKAPKWAQKAAFQIWADQEKNGPVTKKGVRDIVQGTWAKIIYEWSK